MFSYIFILLIQIQIAFLYHLTIDTSNKIDETQFNCLTNYTNSTIIIGGGNGKVDPNLAYNLDQINSSEMMFIGIYITPSINLPVLDQIKPILDVLMPYSSLLPFVFYNVTFDSQNNWSQNFSENIQFITTLLDDTWAYANTFVGIYTDKISWTKITNNSALPDFDSYVFLWERIYSGSQNCSNTSTPFGPWNDPDFLRYSISPSQECNVVFNQDLWCSLGLDSSDFHPFFENIKLAKLKKKFH
ncbi:lysozyme protein [Anaeramoeba ignava]|uniref:Lysozyme protein n=1 Tax=Anaeramoeba ignava TaxID=1746090 RepID=A0A9Q0LBC2_ANAIG|nr:lysozyme protein [Anaeramoeba ignava]